jgi:hypothetical protein
MLIRISLIIALLAGLAAGGLAFVKVKQQAEDIIGQRDDYHKKRDAEEQAKKKALAELKTTKAELDTTKTDLETTKSDLAAANTKASTLEKKAEDLDEKLKKTTAERDSAQQDLAAYQVLGVTPKDIKALQVNLASTTKKLDAYVGENKVILRKNTELLAKIQELIGNPEDVVLPAGLKGKIVAVDPRYDFVVLNIGANQGVLERGKLLVNRAGKLIGKVQIVSVEPDRCIANVLAAYKAGDVSEGDEVLY